MSAAQAALYLVAVALWPALREIVAGSRPALGELSRGHWLAIGAGFPIAGSRGSIS
ncbi:MAG: hypothetical protein ABI821_15580 [Pseudomonadota bacterium]